MALIAWYKLDGDALDSSGNGRHINISGATLSDGKIGKCYEFASGNKITANNISIGYSCTISAWGYATSYSNSMMLFSLNSADWSGADLYFTSGTVCWNTGDGNSNPFKNNGANVTQPSLNTWHHYATVVDADKNKVLLYVNGDYYGEATYKSPYQVNRQFIIGNYSSGTSYAWRGKIDDVRVYDHALSPKEVKELARAKILHYKFDDFQEPTTNEYAYPNFNTSESNGGWSHWGRAGHQGTYGQNTDPQYIYGNQIYSHWVANESSATGDYLVYQSPAFEGGYRSAQVIVCAEDKGEITNSKVYPNWNARSGGTPNDAWTSIEQIPGTHFYHCKCEGIMQDGSNDLVGFFVTKGQKIYFSMAQLEQKPYCTPYTPNIRTGTIHDSSGYDNHAELALATTPKWTEDAKIGSGCYEFDGVSSQITTTVDNLVTYKDPITLACWLKISNDFEWTSGGTILSLGATYYGMGIYRSASNNVLVFASRIGSISSYGTTSITIERDQWYHLVFRGTGAHFDVFVDGTKRASNRSYGVSEGAELNKTLRIATATIYGGSGGIRLKGSMDDVRVYLGALSDEDILELYQTRGSLDNHGNLYVQGGLIEYPVNGCPPFSSWTLSGGAYLSGDVLILPQRGSSAISPFVDIDGKSWTWSVDFYSNSPKDGSVTDGGYLQGSNYYDSNKNPTLNTAGYSSNGNAGTYPINQWTRKVWSYVAGNSVKYLRINISNSASYTPVSFMAKNPAITINGTSSFVPYNSQSLLTTTPNISHTQEGNISSNVLSELGPTNGLIAYYPLNGNANDYSGNNNHGTNNGATITSGIRGSAYSFNGSSSYIRANNILSQGSPFSISFWTKVFGTSTQCLGCTRTATGNGMSIFIISNKIRFDTDHQWTTGYTVPRNEWIHITLTQDHSGKRLYVNSLLEDSTSSTGSMSNLSSIFQIGASHSNGSNLGNYLDGIVCDYRIYNRALSSEEIKILYNVTKPNAIPMQLSSDGIVYPAGELKEV